ncbi:MAG TPA: DNA repair protein RadA, partial [Gemmatimonadales bacterium]
MARARSVFRCAECGHEHPKWVGRCEACGAWSSVAEEPIAASRTDRRLARGGTRRSTTPPPVRLADIAPQRLARWSTGIPEFDFVLGGGVVPGSLTLIGG